MSSARERRLHEFVDRGKEMAAFETLLRCETTARIAVVWGDTLSGKSSLLQRMMKSADDAAAAGQVLRSVSVNWRGASSWDYLGFMREVRKQLGTDLFPTFTSHVNLHFSVGPQPVTININTPAMNILQDADIQGQVGPIHMVHIADHGIVVPRGDLAIDDAGRMTQLTAAFLEDLSTLAKEQTIVFFLDAFENASPTTIQWLWDYLLDPVRDGTITNLLFVVCGQNSPPNREGWLRDIIDMKLPPLAEKDIDEYLVRRGIDNEAMRAIFVATLVAHTDRRPGEIANYVDATLNCLPTGSP